MIGIIEVEALHTTLKSDLKWQDSDITVTHKNLGTAEMVLVFRLVPQLVISFNGMMDTSDGAFDLKGNTHSFSENNCLSEVTSIIVSSYVSSNIVFEFQDPVEMARDACFQAIVLALGNHISTIATLVASAATGVDIEGEIKIVCNEIINKIDHDH